MNEAKTTRPWSYLIIANLLFVLSIIGSIAILYYWEKIKRFSGYGYPLVFVMSFVAGSPLPVPDPYMVTVFTMAPLLNPILLGVISGVGVAAGQTSAFLLGRLGRNSFLWLRAASPGTSRISRSASRLTQWVKKENPFAVLILSAMFNPIFTPIAITMGALRFELLKFFIMCLIGNILKSLFIAGFGYFGLGTLLRFLGLRF